MDLINGMPYVNFHELNMDWIIKVVKDFLDQYTHLQETIENGLISLDEKTATGLDALDEKAQTLQSLLQAWYDTHSEDIATQLARALAEMNQLLATNTGLFDTHADAKATQTIQSIPADYTAFYGMALKVLEPINGTGTIDCNNLADNSIQHINANANILHGPQFAPGNITWMIETFTTSFAGQAMKIQTLRKANDLTTYASRTYIEAVMSDWEPWAYHGTDIRRTLQTFNGTIDCNSLDDNTLQLFNANATIVNGPANAPAFGTDTWAVETISTVFLGQSFKHQMMYNTMDRSAWYAARTKIEAVSSDWFNWELRYGQPPVIHVGPGQTFTRLRDGMGFANRFRGSTVYVHAGVYDLAQEYDDEIRDASFPMDVGIDLGNDVTVIFYDGAKVKALFDNSSGTYTNDQWIYLRDHFAPFHTIAQNDNNYTLHNLDLEVSNCRYGIHDELWGQYTGIHKYYHCRIKNTYTRETPTYPQCIGSGMGTHSTIVIEGGYFISQYTSPVGEMKPTLSFHNGITDQCEGSISISNAYIDNDGFIQLGCYGTSTIKTRAMVTGCKMGYPVRKIMETQDYDTDNFTIVAWNNDIAHDQPWQ